MSSRFTSPFPSIPLDPCRQSLCTYAFSRDGEHDPNKTCYIDGLTGEDVTRAEHRNRVMFLAAAFRNLEAAGLRGLHIGSTVVVFSPNTVLYPALMFAFSAAGITPAYVSSNYVEKELIHSYKISQASHIFVHLSLLPIAQRTLATLGYSEEEAKKRTLILAWDQDIPIDLLKSGWRGLERLVPHPSLSNLPESFDGAKADEPAALYFSSGTTGMNKAIALTHLNITFNIASMAACWQWFTQDDVVLTVLPFFHIYGAANGVLLNIIMGVPFVFLPRFIPEAFLSAIDKYKVSAMPLVPPLLNFLASHPLVDQYDLRSLRCFGVGAAPVIPSMLDRCFERLAKRGVHLEMSAGYGLTECTGLITFVPTKQRAGKHGSVGVLIPNSEGRIVGEDGEDVPLGQSGEIWLRSPAVMKEYFGNPQATAETLTPDGWLQTGDIGVTDDEGYIYIVDRKKELIKYKGFQVAPMELEEVLSEHAEIADSAVIGVVDDEGNELPRAYVVPRDISLLDREHTVMVQNIHSWLRDKVAHYKQLRGGIVLIDSIPRSQVGKILRRTLRDATKIATEPIRPKL